MKDDNKQHATDTLRDLTKNPKEALKEDYDQTKADMQQMKEKVMGDDDEEKIDETM
jgi:hypothetical protein